MHARRFLLLAAALPALLITSVAAASGRPSFHHVLHRIDEMARRADPDTRRELLSLREEIAALDDGGRSPHRGPSIVPDDVLAQIIGAIAHAPVTQEVTVIRGAARMWSFRTDQVRQILRITNDANEVEAGVLLYPSTVDSWRWNDVYSGTSSFEVDREIERRIAESY